MGACENAQLKTQISEKKSKRKKQEQKTRVTNRNSNE
jgi:hypothetical protein